MADYYTYVMSNKGRTVLYGGVTNGLTKRVLQHRSGKTDGFTCRYHCDRLVYFERFAKPSEAIAREKQLKGWRRQKKEELIASQNPQWEDLAVTVLGFLLRLVALGTGSDLAVIPSLSRDLGMGPKATRG